MSRLGSGVLAGLACALCAATAYAADGFYGNEPLFRPAYDLAWQEDYEDSLGFEFGLRYFYGMGGQNASIGPLDFSSEDASHFVELHARIDDYSTSTYLKGNLGVAGVIDGTYETPTSGGTQSTDSGTIVYGGADLGYLAMMGDSFGIGGFVGYQYLNESIDMGRSSFMTSGGGGDSHPNSLEVHGLRLGATARAEFGNAIDFTVDAAVIPTAYLSGTYGAFDVRAADPAVTPGNAATISGNLYGGAVDAMVGFRATENMVIRAGARGYYLTGPTETYFELRDPANPAVAQGFRTDGTIELFRWGPVVELTGTF